MPCRRKPPNTLPLVGNGILFLQARENLFSWFAKCERIFGHETFELYVPSLPPGVVINDPVNLDFIFKNEGAFSKGDFVKKPLWDLFGQYRNYFPPSLPAGQATVFEGSSPVID